MAVEAWHARVQEHFASVGRAHLLPRVLTFLSVPPPLPPFYMANFTSRTEVFEAGGVDYAVNVGVRCGFGTPYWRCKVMEVQPDDVRGFPGGLAYTDLAEFRARYEALDALERFPCAGLYPDNE